MGRMFDIDRSAVIASTLHVIPRQCGFARGRLRSVCVALAAIAPLATVAVATLWPVACVRSDEPSRQAAREQPPAAEQPAASEKPAAPEKIVRRSDDFEVTGRGDHPAWQRAQWTNLVRHEQGKLPYESRFKLLYSSTGLYVLLDGTDARLTAAMNEDFAELWKEDVYEFFLWPDERMAVYFEYEISPLGHELPILVPNVDGKFLGWRPWVYEGDRKVSKAVAVFGGEATPGSEITGWRAEVFVPFRLLRPLGNVPPQSGTRWRANFCRIDHDHDQRTTWDWSRLPGGFHRYADFGTIHFE